MCSQLSRKCGREKSHPNFALALLFPLCLLKPRQIIRFGIEQLQGHLLNLAWAADGGAEGVEEQGMDGGFFTALDGGGGSEVVHPHVRRAQCSHLRRQGAVAGGIDAVGIHHAGDFNDAVGGQVGDQRAAAVAEGV